MPPTGLRRSRLQGVRLLLAFTSFVSLSTLIPMLERTNVYDLLSEGPPREDWDATLSSDIGAMNQTEDGPLDLPVANKEKGNNGTFRSDVTSPSKLSATVVHPNRSENGFSACVLTMDDNILWPEWLAYHYQTLPLRRLIVALDPKSRTKPTELFDRYRRHGLFLNATVWENDEYIEDQDMKMWINANTTSDMELLAHYLKRQKYFLHRCLEQLYTEKRTWVLLVDTDELLVPWWRNLIVSEERETTSGNDDSSRSILESLTTQASKVFSVDLNANYSQWLNHTDHGCFYLYRKRFMPRSSNETMLPTQGLPIHLLTVEQDHYIGQHNGKVMLDLSKVSPEMARLVFNNGTLGNFTSPHLGIDPLCAPIKVKALAHRPFFVHHYGVNLPRISERDNDPRLIMKLKQWKKEQKRAKLVFNHTHLPFASAWVDAFLKSLTEEVAFDLLRPMEDQHSLDEGLQPEQSNGASVTY